MKTITLPIPKCSCGCEGDLIIKMSDGLVQYIVCDCCGENITPDNLEDYYKRTEP